MREQESSAPSVSAPPVDQPVAYITEPNTDEWDAFVRSHRYGHLLQSVGWGALKEQSGWRAQRVAVAGPAGLLAGAQLLTRSRYGLSAVYAPRGPLLCSDAAVNRLLFEAMERVARRQRAVFLRIEPNLLEFTDEADALHTLLMLEGWRTTATLQPRSTIHLDLRPPEAALLAAFSKGHRADIRRAERQGVTVRAGVSSADLGAFFQMMQATSDRKAGYGIHAESYYRAAWEIFSSTATSLRSAAALWVAELEGQTVGACMVFAGAGEGLYLYGGSNESGLKAGANHLLQWRAIRWAGEVGCVRYDMWGIPDALGRAAGAGEAERATLEEAARGDPLYGVYRFKKGFGGHVVRYLPAYDQVYLWPAYALWQRGWG